jgi:hypothetical protein
MQGRAADMRYASVHVWSLHQLARVSFDLANRYNVAPTSTARRTMTRS